MRVKQDKDSDKIIRMQFEHLFNIYTDKEILAYAKRIVYKAKKAFKITKMLARLHEKKGGAAVTEWFERQKKKESARTAP
jgi:hypothetical protein